MSQERNTFHYNTSWEKIARVFPKGEKLTILDIGCGDGRIVQHLTNIHTVHGLDTSGAAVAAARRAGIDAERVDLNQPMPYKDETFDIVLALDVLEHLTDVKGRLAECKRVMKHDGYLIISIPNHFDLRTRIDVMRGKGIIKWSQRMYETEPEVYSHIRFWTLSEFSSMLRGLDFYPDLWQFNFMSQGLLPTDLIQASLRRWLVKNFPNAWSGKFVVRCRKTEPDTAKQIIIDRTPTDF